MRLSLFGVWGVICLSATMVLTDRCEADPLFPPGPFHFLSTNNASPLTSTSGYVDARQDFGAVGDGVTDDAPALQAALRAASNGTLYLPTGRYLCNAKLVIPSVTWVGDGGDATEVVFAGSFLPPSNGIVNVAMHNQQFAWGETRDGFDRLHFSGLYFHMSVPTNVACQYLLCLGNLVNSTFEDCHLRCDASGATNRCINLDATFTNVAFTGILSEQMCSNGWIGGPFILDTASTTVSRGLLVQNSTFIGSSWDEVFFVGPGAATALPTTVEGVRICGNRFISCGPSNSFIVSFVGGSDGPVSVNTTLSDVEVINNTFSATNSKLGVIQVDGFGCLSNVLFAQNVVVANSAFYDNLPMLVSYAPGTAAKVRFQDNLWVNASPGPLKCAFEYLPPEYMVTMDTLFGQYAAITAGCRAQIQSLWVTNTPLSGLGLTKSHGTGSLTATLNHLPPSAVADVAAPPAPNEPAPALVDEASFLGDSRSRVYPRASAERWGPLPSGRSMLLQTLDAQSGLQGGGTSSIPFSFTLRSTANRVVVVEACTNLTNPAWVPLATNNITGVSAYFSDPQSASYAARYYRLRLP